MGFLSCWLVSVFPNRPVVFLVFATTITQSAFFNPLFHIGATAAFGVYCPGVITSLTIYPAVFYYLSRLAFREKLLSNKSALVSFIMDPRNWTGG